MGCGGVEISSAQARGAAQSNRGCLGGDRSIRIFVSGEEDGITCPAGVKTLEHVLWGLGCRDGVDCRVKRRGLRYGHCAVSSRRACSTKEVTSCDTDLAQTTHFKNPVFDLRKTMCTPVKIHAKKSHMSVCLFRYCPNHSDSGPLLRPFEAGAEAETWFQSRPTPLQLAQIRPWQPLSQMR
jgi:hypothetical protein